VDIPRPREGWWQQVPVLNELYKLLSSSEPVNWELARQVATALGSEDEPDIGDLGALQTDLESISRAANLEAESFSGLLSGEVAPVRAVSRAEWVEANISSFRYLMNPLASKMSGPAALGLPPELEGLGVDLGQLPGGAGQVLQQVSGIFMGLQTGFVMGYLVRGVIGQYELALPSPEGGRLLYVASNLVAVERDWEVDPTEFRYWIALHEVTHHLEFSRPWVRKYYHSQLRTLIDSLDFDPQRMGSAFEGFEMLDPERLAQALADPERVSNAAWTPLAEDAMSRLSAFMTLVEGYATFVMDAVGAKLLSSHTRLKEVMERRKRSTSPGDVLLERLLGLELKRRQYEEGVRFCRYVAGMRDVESLNRVWDNPDSLPTADELADPDAWITRVLDDGGGS
jgi:coenzyme F420 biosynthesis associated uncharacterized protein